MALRLEAAVGGDAETWLTDVLSCIADHKIDRIDKLLPWPYAQRS